MVRDGDELLRLLILAVLRKADRPMTAEDLRVEVERLYGALRWGAPAPVRERGH